MKPVAYDYGCANDKKGTGNMSLSAHISEKAALIWAIADKLTGVYKPHEYGEVILPLTVIRRFDCILADTKDEVLAKYEEVKNLPMRDVLLRKASGKAFYNTSKYTFERLLDDPDNIEANFRDYLNGFSENVQDILQNFKFDGQITTMANKGILYIVIKNSPRPRPICTPMRFPTLRWVIFSRRSFADSPSLTTRTPGSTIPQEKSSSSW